MHLRRGPRGTRASWSCFGGTGAARQRHRVATDGGGGGLLPRGWLSRNGTPLHQPSHGAGSFLLPDGLRDRKSTRLNSSHSQISYAVFCLKKKKKKKQYVKIKKKNIIHITV